MKAIKKTQWEGTGKSSVFKTKPTILTNKKISLLLYFPHFVNSINTPLLPNVKDPPSTYTMVLVFIYITLTLDKISIASCLNSSSI